MVATLPETLSTLKSLDENPAIDYCSSGISSLDGILGGGFPKGRLIELVGPTSTGKTTLALQAAAQFQKHGQVLYLDTEHRIDKNYAHACGVDTKSLLFGQPRTAEDALQTALDAAKSGFALVVIDSIAAMPTRSERDCDIGDQHLLGAHSRILSEGLKIIVQELGNASPATILVTNQIRMQQGVTYGSPERATGGLALGYYASLRVDMRRVSTLKRGTHEYGQRVKLKVVKSSVSDPFQITEADLIFGQGFARIHDLFDWGYTLGAVTRKGVGFAIGDEVLGRDRNLCLDALKAKTSGAKLVKKLERAIAQCLKSV